MIIQDLIIKVQEKVIDKLYIFIKNKSSIII